MVNLLLSLSFHAYRVWFHLPCYPFPFLKAKICISYRFKGYTTCNTKVDMAIGVILWLGCLENQIRFFNWNMVTDEMVNC